MPTSSPCRRFRSATCGRLAATLVSLLAMFAGEPALAQPAKVGDQVDRQAVPWGVSSSASAFSNHAEWMPRLAEAGVRWVRLFPEWNTLEPRPGEWNFAPTDALIRTAASHGIEVNAILMGSAPGKGGKPHAFPMNDLAAWSKYVSSVVGRYKDDVHYWEVWNEGNGGFNDDHHTTEDYAKLVAVTYKAVKQADPKAQVGLTVASYDPAYIKQTILALKRQGAANSFDFICLHPYELADNLDDKFGEVPFLWMTPLLRALLKEHAPERAGAEIWLSEVGRKLDVRRGRETSPEQAARALVKIYVLALAQGVKRIQWFEAQDPPGEEAGFGLIDRAGRPRPAYQALKTLREQLGDAPEYLGWLRLGDDERGYGFVFRGREKPVLVAWMPRGELGSVRLPLTMHDPIDAVTGRTPAEDGLNYDEYWGRLTDSPIYQPAAPNWIVARAQANKDKPFAWGGDLANAVAVRFDADVRAEAAGLTHKHIAPQQGVFPSGERSASRITFPDATQGLYVRPNHSTSFWVHPSFATLDESEFYVRLTVRRLDDGNCGMNLFYEVADSQGRTPYKNVGVWFGLSDSRDWQTHTWHVKDACFAKMWGYDLSFRPEQSGAFAIGKVEVSKRPFDD